MQEESGEEVCNDVGPCHHCRHRQKKAHQTWWTRTGSDISTSMRESVRNVLPKVQLLPTKKSNLLHSILYRVVGVTCEKIIIWSVLKSFMYVGGDIMSHSTRVPGYHTPKYKGHVLKGSFPDLE